MWMVQSSEAYALPDADDVNANIDRRLSFVSTEFMLFSTDILICNTVIYPVLTPRYILALFISLIKNK